MLPWASFLPQNMQISSPQPPFNTVRNDFQPCTNQNFMWTTRNLLPFYRLHSSRAQARQRHTNHLPRFRRRSRHKRLILDVSYWHSTLYPKDIIAFSSTFRQPVILYHHQDQTIAFERKSAFEPPIGSRSEGIGILPPPPRLIRLQIVIAR